MTLTERLASDLTAAMKARDAPRTSCLRLAKSALKNQEIEKKSALEDAEVVRILEGLVRQREDSIEQFRKGNRPDLVDKEQKEIEILRAYLPAEATDEEIRSAVEKAVAQTGAQSAKDLGKVMGASLAILKASGKPVDGKKVNEVARGRLGS